MIQVIDTGENLHLNDHESYVHLSGAVRELKLEAKTVLPRMQGRKVWMVNSTAHGGGVAEMMPKLITILRDLGIQADWVVIGTKVEAFFALTKRIHNLIHNFGEAGFSAEERALYDKVSAEVAAEMEALVGPDDILVIHDPQPLGAGALLKQKTGINAVWRCHIGLDRITPVTQSAWDFLKPHAELYDHAVFSAPEYIPPYLVGRASVIYPAIDPLSHKSRDLSAHKLIGILCNAGLMSDAHPVLTSAWKQQAMRLQPDGKFAPANSGLKIGMVYRPVVVQISRWDRLKGYGPLLRAFLLLKRKTSKMAQSDARHRHRLDIVRLVLAGPDPAAVQDDPEGQEVLKELCDLYLGLTPAEQESVAIVTLPMGSRKENHLMVNAIQRCATVAVQNSIEEGFGLTATEAMWKRVPVLGTSACGLRQQIRDEIDGCLTRNPQEPEEIAEKLDHMLANPVDRDQWGRNAQRRVYDRFLVFSQAQAWLQQLSGLMERPQ